VPPLPRTFLPSAGHRAGHARKRPQDSSGAGVNQRDLCILSQGVPFEEGLLERPSLHKDGLSLLALLSPAQGLLQIPLSLAASTSFYSETGVSTVIIILFI
jgi:hypothetical protein